MIAVSQTIVLGAFAGTASGGRSAVPDPALLQSGVGFWQLLADGDAASDTDAAKQAPADATTAGEMLHEDRSEMVVEQPLVAVAFAAPIAPRRVFNDSPNDPVRARFVAPQQSGNDATQPAEIPLVSGSAQKGDANLETQGATVGQFLGLDADSLKAAEAGTLAVVTSPGQQADLESTFANPSFPLTAASSAPVRSIPDQQKHRAEKPAVPQSAASREGPTSPLSYAERNLPPEPFASQPAAMLLAADKPVLGPKAIGPDGDVTTLLPLPDDATVGDAQDSLAETAWRAKWGGFEPVARRVADSGTTTVQSPSGEDVLPSAPSKAKGVKGFAAADGVNIAPSPVDRATGDSHPPSAAAPTKRDATANPPVDTDAAFISPDGTPNAALPDTATFPLTAGSTAQSAAPVSAFLTPASGPPQTAINALAPVIVELTKAGNDGPTELTLAPEELGRLTISLRQEGDFVRVSMMAERPETLDLLRRHVGDLLADLRQSGFSGASFNFGQSGQDQTKQSAARAFAAEDAPPSQPAPVEFKQSTLGRPHQGVGLDLRF